MTVEQPLRVERPTISDEVRFALAALSAGDADILAAVGVQEAEREASGLDARAFALVKIAVLVALDAPPASYIWQITNAMANDVPAEDILAVLRAIAPQVGLPRVVAAAPEIMIALGLNLPGEPVVSP
ncbi:MAG: carboxymuconolactone decarboxylase family protein [Motilibacteraceae bacterium]